ncbi:MAG: hypothetical protein ABL890_03840 [Candidatus Peribacteraceae bacterium]
MTIVLSRDIETDDLDNFRGRRSRELRREVAARENAASSPPVDRTIASIHRVADQSTVTNEKLRLSVT